MTTLPTRVKRGDTPTLTGTVGDEAGPVDISGAQSVTLRLTPQRTGTLPPYLERTVENLDTGTPTRGTWRYKVAPNEFAVSGTYSVTVTVRWLDGTQYTFPSQGSEEIVVEDW